MNQEDGAFKTVYLLRHAHSEINNAGASRNVFDPPLSAVGRDQIKHLSRNSAEEMDPHIVFVSPLTRALETATVMFDCYFPSDRDDVCPVVALEEAREIITDSPSERRRSVDALATAFPSVDFSALPSGPDQYPVEHRVELFSRALQMWRHVLSSPSHCSRIVVVSHFHLIKTMLLQFNLACGDENANATATSYDLQNGGIVTLQCSIPRDLEYNSQPTHNDNADWLRRNLREGGAQRGVVVVDNK